MGRSDIPERMEKVEQTTPVREDDRRSTQLAGICEAMHAVAIDAEQREDIWDCEAVGGNGSEAWCNTLSVMWRTWTRRLMLTAWSGCRAAWLGARAALGHVFSQLEFVSTSNGKHRVRCPLSCRKNSAFDFPVHSTRGHTTPTPSLGQDLTRIFEHLPAVSASPIQ